MKFEKISDSKFKLFKKDEVVNPILISGGAYDTSNAVAGTHDKVGATAGSPRGDTLTTANGENFTQDGQTTADHSDVT